MINTFLKLLVKGYRYFLSPFLGRHCRFHPTCSDYCLQSLQAFSTSRAIWLTAKRLARCHPWSAGGADPLPEGLD